MRKRITGEELTRANVVTADQTLVAYCTVMVDSQSIMARIELLDKLEEAINDLRKAVTE